jgi:uncharacterized protein involved in response to NO
MADPISEETSNDVADVLAATPFRLFFLLAGVFAALWLPLWISILFRGSPTLLTNLGAIGWHGHEMLFGYTGAVLAGFLLTAARAWTGRPTISGLPLLALVALWCLGRVAALRSAGLPPMLPILLDGGFWLMTAAATARPIIAARSRRNWAFPVLLLIIGASDVVIHLHVTHAVSPLWSARGLPVAMDAIALIILIFGGRILPLFTGNAIDDLTPRKKGILDWLGLGAMVALMIAHAASTRPGPVVHWLALGAGVLNTARLWGWGGTRTLGSPILWVLHLGWLLLGASIIMQGLAGLYDRISPSAAQHMFTVGGLGVTTLGMMARVSLGHTGRKLKVPASVAIAFGILAVATMVRVVLPIAEPTLYLTALKISGLAWAAAFAIFTVRYAPILVSPRVDGKPG